MDRSAKRPGAQSQHGAAKQSEDGVVRAGSCDRRVTCQIEGTFHMRGSPQGLGIIDTKPIGKIIQYRNRARVPATYLAAGF
jgi:hypothetical protein